MRLKLDQKYFGWVILGGVVTFGCNPQSQESQLEQSSVFQATEFPVENFPESFGLGRVANKKEIDSLSIAIPPSGKGLPPGEGLALRGKSTYLQKCAACHGLEGKEGPQDALVSKDPIFSENSRTKRAIGNYWPYATTVFDYIRRAMPSNAPGSLTNQEVYDITAWILFQNGLIQQDFVINSETLPKVEMPAKIRFVQDYRTGGPNPVY